MIYSITITIGKRVQHEQKLVLLKQKAKDFLTTGASNRKAWRSARGSAM